ncbi:MAG TPA: two-component regulator propeller domain-containing protein [Chitinophagaceae bacterium]
MSLPAKMFLLLLLTASEVVGQTPFSRSWALPTEVTTPVINTICQDKTGYILVGASTGLYRFDGNAFYKFPKTTDVPDNVTAIGITRKSTWIGFADGKLGWLRNNKLVIQAAEEGFPAKAIRRIIEDVTGTVWIATAGEGVYYFRGNRFYNINTDDGLSDNYVYDLQEDLTGIYAATDRGINRIVLLNNGKRVSSFTSKNGLPDNIIRSVSTAAEGFWISMQDAGIGFYNRRNFEPVQTAAAIPVATGQVNDLLQANHCLYAASEESGLIRYEINGRRLLNPQVVAPQKMVALLEDTEGNIWGAGNNQLVRTNGSKLQPVVQLQPAEAAALRALLIDREGHIWYNVPKGLKHLSNDSAGKWNERIFSLPVDINSQITALFEDRFGNIWIGTMGNGAFILDSRSGRFRQITENNLLTHSSVLSISGKAHLVWIAGLEGVVQCTLTSANADIQAPVNVTDFTGTVEPTMNYIYHVFTDSRNRTWFATDGKGVSVYENGKIRNYNEQNGLRSAVVYKITEDREKNIWFTTFNSGLVKYDGKKFLHFTTAQGLSDAQVTAMTSDGKGNLYLSHEKGIDIIDPVTHTISYLDQEQGLAGVNTDLNTLTSCPKGDVYFVSGNNIYRYDATRAIAAPRIVIDRIQLFLNDVDIENGHTFSSSDDNISFYYTGLYYTQPGKIQYQYKLDGFGEDWITTNDRRRDFPKLAPGTYTFRVRASLNRNFDNAPEASFKFTIRKPLWARWWFIALVFSAIGLLLYYYIRAREKNLQQMERLEREKIRSQFETLRNQVNPHFLFNSFNTLVSEIENDPAKAVRYVEHMADFFRSIVTYREKDVISLGEEIGIIKDYLFIQEKRYGNAFQVSIGVSPEEETEYYIAPLTLQLLAENAIKHNSVLKEKPLVLKIFVEAGQLVVRNNINPKLHPERSAGLGLQNIRRRYELLTKRPVVITADEEYFTVVVPLIKLSDDKGTDHRR